MTEQLPGTSRADEDMQGHWLLVKLGKRVLRPGGRELTERLLCLAGVPNVDVVELAPGCGLRCAAGGSRCRRDRSGWGVRGPRH
ncbi:MAG: hypothetical protein ACTH03_10820, partial [Corynebacterium casei]